MWLWPGQGSRLRCADGDGNGVDRLSGLPEEIRLLILGRLRSVRDAVRTGVLSRQWRGLWTSLPELAFVDVEPDIIELVLAQVTRPALDLLNILLVIVERQRISSLLSAVARVAPKSFALSMSGYTWPIGDTATKLPCLDHTVSLQIDMCGLPLTPPPSGEFTALHSLSLSRCSIDTNALLLLCPNLRVLDLFNCLFEDDGHGDVAAVVHSPSIEELVLTTNKDRIDIVAPVLKKVTVTVNVLYPAEPLLVSLSAPNLNESEWRIILDDDFCVAFGLWRLHNVYQRIVKDQMPCVSIHVTAYVDGLNQDWDFAQAIAELPVANFSCLDLQIEPDGHVFGPMVLHLLGFQPGIQNLKISLEQCEEETPCTVNCSCEESSNWRSENVALTKLEVIEIVGLEGTDHEVDFLKVLFRCATMLQKMIVRLSDEVSSTASAYEKIHSVFKEYPNVKCFLLTTF